MKKSCVQSVRNLIFSKRCPICKRLVSGNNYICDSCYRVLRNKSSLKRLADTNIYYVFFYDEKIRDLIADFKLKNRRALGDEIASLVGSEIKKLMREKEIDVVIPVPISKKREAERGFNQVEEILKSCKIEYKKIERVRDTEHMFFIKEERDRVKNVYGAFKNRLDIEDKKVLVVDDIITTGSTMDEIKKEILKGYPKEIYVFCIAISKHYKV